MDMHQARGRPRLRRFGRRRGPLMPRHPGHLRCCSPYGL